MKLHGPIPPALPEPFHKRPDPDGIVPGNATRNLVDAQVSALLAETPSYGDLNQDERSAVHDRMVHIASYAAELVRDDWYHSEILGQRPLLQEKMEMIPSNTQGPEGSDLEKMNRRHSTPARIQSQTALVRAQSNDDFVPASANQVARVTRETLRAIAFPTFVADLIRGSFQAIVDSTIQQMEAFGELLSNVSKSVDEFMADNITDNQARDWLAARYPGLMRVNTSGEMPRLNPIDTDADSPLPDFRAELNIPDSVDSLDESVLEETLMPAARRRLAQSRLQVLSTMVMMGLQRIVVKHGRIRATMGFHIDTTDRMHREEATNFDFNASLSGSASFLMYSASVSTSVTYVRSTSMDSDTELNVEADLTGEVDITFESDYMPLNRFASAAQIEQIRANTPVPENNAPSAAATGQPATRTPATRPPSTSRTPATRPPSTSRTPAARTPAATPPATGTPPASGTPATGTPPASGTPATGTPPASGTPATGTPPVSGTPATGTPPVSGTPATGTPPASGTPATGTPPASGTPPAGTPPAQVPAAATA